MAALRPDAGVVLGVWSGTAAAQAAGTVIQLTGTLSALRGGATRILSMKSEVQRGDTLVTQRDSYEIGRSHV